MLYLRCINNDKCENFLDVDNIYLARTSKREDCYSVFIKDKKNRISSKEYDFKKDRFEVLSELSKFANEWVNTF